MKINSKLSSIKKRFSLSFPINSNDSQLPFLFLKYSLIFPALLYGNSALAAPDDLFLQAQNLNSQRDTWSIQASADGLNDTIDIFNLRDEDKNPNGTGDYLGGTFEAHYNLNSQFSIEGKYWHREIDYANDTNKMDSWLVGIRYIPEVFSNDSDTFSLRASLWGNIADELKKDTPTIINDRRFEQIQVNNAKDLQLQLDGIFSHRINSTNQLNAFASVGYSKVEVDSLDTQLNYNGCLASVSIQSNNQFTGSLSPLCRSFAISGDASAFGLDLNQDLNYKATYASAGGSWNWRYHKFESQLAYQYQYLWRQDIDDRIENFGTSTIKDNHRIGLKLSYDFLPRLSGFIQAQYVEHNFIGTIPFLYNGITLSRLDDHYGYASIGLKLHSF